MSFDLDSAELRVLGTLIEKEMATPEYYPLTLNALVSACNQKSNRDPVVAYDDATVEEALDRLRSRGLAAIITGAGLRAAKHRETLSESLNLGRRELALLCELMLRGGQTVGELHGRCVRLHEFTDAEEVEACLQRLTGRDPDPLAVKLPRRPGTKEPRYAHLLAGPPASEPAAASAPSQPREDRLTALEAEIAALRSEVADLKERFAAFRRQFE